MRTRKTPTIRKIWDAYYDMIKRCYYKGNNRYHRYGARGITVCERWRNNRQNFIADMGAPPTREHSLGRLNNDGNYEPGNCAWQTLLEQNSNNRGNGLVWTHGAIYERERKKTGRRLTTTETAVIRRQEMSL
jgi:hypothetical protein